MSTRPSSKHNAAAAVSGLLFGAGLASSGMTNPNKVIGFLDVFGAWDASLACVMLGAIGVHVIAYRFVLRRPSPLFSERFAVPTRRDIDARLLIGAAVFGAGWGLGGYCPGPALVSLPSIGAGVVVFVAAMLAGMFATAKLDAALAGRSTRLAQSAPRASLALEQSHRE